MSWQQHWQPGHKQHKQRGVTRRKSRAYYVRNRSKILSRQRRRRSQSSWKNNPARKRSEARRRNLNRHRVAGRDFAPPYQRGGEKGKPQHVQTPSKKREDARAYKSDTKRKRDSAAYYHLVCKRDPNCMRRREEYREHPEKYKRKKAPIRKSSVLTKPNIAFTLGNNGGVVDRVSPMTGMVTFRLFDINTMPIASLPVRVFMAAVTFLTEEDTQSFFELIETEIGLEVYDDLTWAEIRACQGLFRFVPEALSSCIELLGEDPPVYESPVGTDALVSTYGVLEGGINRYLPYMFYGGIEEDMATPERLKQIKKELITGFLESYPSESRLEAEGQRLIKVLGLLNQPVPKVLQEEVKAALAGNPYEGTGNTFGKDHSATPPLWKELQRALEKSLDVDMMIQAGKVNFQEISKKGRLNRILAEEGFFTKQANPFSDWGFYTPETEEDEVLVEEAETEVTALLERVKNSSEAKVAVVVLRSLAGQELIMTFPQIVKPANALILKYMTPFSKAYASIGAGDGETLAMFKNKVYTDLLDRAETHNRLRPAIFTGIR